MLLVCVNPDILNLALTYQRGLYEKKIYPGDNLYLPLNSYRDKARINMHWCLSLQGLPGTSVISNSHEK